MLDYSSFYDDKTLLITGGSGSFGQAFIKILLRHAKPKKVIIFSRDEWKHSQMREEEELFNDPCIRYFLGDIRDKERLLQAFREVDYIVHAAALKQVPAAEYNPTEFVKTNILGTINVVEAAIDCGVNKVISLSTDKSVAPVNLYGATKLCADKVLLSGEVYVGNRRHPLFAIVRYGNVLGSRGSLIPKWQKLIENECDSLPITDERMTRFWITMERAASFVLDSLINFNGGEIFVPKIPSMKILDLAKSMAPNIPIKICGIRPGEKLHEQLITKEESMRTYEENDYYIVYSKQNEKLAHKKVVDGFEYTSDKNDRWITEDEFNNVFLSSACLTT